MAVEVDPLRIAYLIQQFPPEIGAGPARALEMAHRWRAGGAEVTIITAMPNRPQGCIHPRYRGKAFLTEEWEGIPVLRSWLYARPEGGTPGMILNNASFMITGTLRGLVGSRSFDVLIASSPPFFVHLAGEMIRMGRRVPLILEVRDLWPDYLVQMGIVRAKSLQRALFGLEGGLLKRAARVVVVTNSFRDRVVSKGVAADHVALIPNGVDLGLYYREVPDNGAAAASSKQDDFVIGYLGNFGAGQQLETVLDAAAILSREVSTVRFVLVGDGPRRSALVAKLKQMQLKNVEILEPIAKELTRHFYNACDACLVPLAPIPIFAEAIPSKLFEIMACERPVIGSLSGEAEHIIRRSQCGLVSPPGEAESLAKAIRKIRDMKPVERLALGQNGRAYVASHYNRDDLATQYLALLEEVARDAKR